MERKYKSIRLEITSQCNLNCLYCHNCKKINPSKDMKVKDILKLISGLKQEYDIDKLLITGGEPLINIGIFKIIKFATDLGIKVDMVTNGTLLSDKTILKLEECGLKRLRISIDEVGNITKVRDDISPNFLWDKAIRIKELSNIEVCIHTVASIYNIEQLFDVYQKVLEVGARRWRVFDLGYQGGIVLNKEKFSFNNYYDNLIDSAQEIIEDYLKNNYKDILDIEINNIFKTSFLDLKYSDIENLKLKDIYDLKLNSGTCSYVADHQLTIRSDGKATLCQYFNNSIFDFKEFDYNVKETIKNKKYCVENEMKTKELTNCKNCKYFLVCNSGCRSRALFLTGDIKEADPCACYLHQLVHHKIMTLLPEEILKVYEWYIDESKNNPKFTIEEMNNFLKVKGY